MHLTDAIEQIRPSVFQVLIDTEGSVDGPVVAGTGFLVHSDGFGLTAGHVVEDALRFIESKGGRLLAGLAIPELTGPVTIRASFELVPIVVAEQDSRHDLGLLKLDPNPFASGRASGVSQTPDGVAVNALYGLAPLSLARVRDGESVAVSGYPSGAPALVTTHGVIASATAFDLVDVHLPGAPDGFTIPDVKDSYLIDVSVNPGNSGGPVYSIFHGEVIALCVAFRVAEALPASGSPFAYNSGLAVAVPIKYGLELLQRHAAI